MALSLHSRLLTILVLGALLHSGEGGKCGTYNATPVDVNDDWFFTFASEGMVNPMGTKFQLKQGFGAKAQPEDDKNLNTTMCGTARFKVLIHTFDLAVVFKYNRINEFKGLVQTEGTPAAGFFKLYGDFVMAMTDNATYVLFFGCIFNTQPFWQVQSPLNETISDKNRERILKYIEKNGFSRDSDAISSSSDPIWLERASISKCGEKKGLAGHGSASSATGALGSGTSVLGSKKDKKDKKEKGVLEELISKVTDLLSLKT